MRHKALKLAFDRGYGQAVQHTCSKALRPCRYSGRPARLLGSALAAVENAVERS